MSILIYTYHIAIDTVSICIYVYVYLYILSGKICYIFLILTEILKRNPSTPTTGERKVVGQFQVFVGSQFDAGNIAMSWTSPIFLADTSPRIVRVLPCVYQVVTLFSHCFPIVFPVVMMAFSHHFTMAFPVGFPDGHQVRIANGPVGGPYWWTRRRKSSLAAGSFGEAHWNDDV